MRTYSTMTIMGQNSKICHQIDPLIVRTCTAEEEAACMIAVSDLRRDLLRAALSIAILVTSVWSYQTIKEYSDSSTINPSVVKVVTNVEGSTSSPFIEPALLQDLESNVPDLTSDTIPEQVIEIRDKVISEHGTDTLPAVCDEVLNLLKIEEIPAWMGYVAWRESRCQADVKRLLSSTGDQSFGYFQINTLDNLWLEVQKVCGINERHVLLDPKINVACAAKLYRRYGYKPWYSGVYFQAP
jgi:hypothetical protein